jgi:hypothetical protein
MIATALINAFTNRKNGLPTLRVDRGGNKNY